MKYEKKLLTEILLNISPGIAKIQAIYTKKCHVLHRDNLKFIGL